uniref:Ureidoglycolate hydrolase n=1 Tax=viral metagenome TaxID=1070528 RepID=A0A6C0KIC4_9ZZZZ
MSGYALYDPTELLSLPSCSVPIIKATSENFKDYGNFVYDYEEENVIIESWPINGKRKLYPGTGIGGGIAEGKFSYKYDNNLLYAKNEAVGGSYITGITLTKNNNENNEDEKYIITREANYHPDGGQVFYPLSPDPFILLLALSGDDVKASDYVGFYFDGSCGCQIKANIWHQPVYPLANESCFMTKQGAVHGCVCYDSVVEENITLKIKLHNI